MKLESQDFETDGLAAAERLKGNLRIALECLRDRESTILVNHIIHDVADLVSAYGEKHLKDQYKEIISLASKGLSHSDDTHETPESTERNSGEYNRESGRIRDANRDLLENMSAMRSAVKRMEEKRRAEVRSVTAELEKYKRLLSEAEKRIINERIANRRLKNKLDRITLSSRSQSCHTTSSRSSSSEYDSYDNGRFGFGALTVRSCKSRHQGWDAPQTSRPVSAKSRKHRRD